MTKNYVIVAKSMSVERIGTFIFFPPIIFPPSFSIKNAVENYKIAKVKVRVVETMLSLWLILGLMVAFM
jgi:hypothetical protein